MKTKSIILYLGCMLIVSISGLVLSSCIIQGNTKGSVIEDNQSALALFDNPSEVVVKINSIENITATTADCNYNIRVIITGDNKIRVTETGANVWKVPMNNGATGPAAKFTGRSTTGDNYKTKLTGLLPKTKYYISAYAISNEGKVSSTKQVFETKLN